MIEEATAFGRKQTLRFDPTPSPELDRRVGH